MAKTDRCQQRSTASAALAAEQARHTLAKDEVQKARLALATVKTAAQQESKRKEHELASALSRWQKVSAAGPYTHPSIILNGPERISQMSRSSLSGRHTPSEVALLESSLQRLDESRNAVQEENIHIREVLGDVINEVRATLDSIQVPMPKLEDLKQDQGDGVSVKLVKRSLRSLMSIRMSPAYTEPDTSPDYGAE